jgi:hypothetical protein
MRKRKRVVLLGACLLVAALLVSLLARESGPRYNGRSLSKWVVLYDKHAMTQESPEFAEAVQAIQTIGTNALPYLLKWIQQEPPSWQRTALRTLPPLFLG